MAAPAAAMGGDDIDPPMHGMLAMPPRIPAAQSVIDLLILLRRLPGLDPLEPKPRDLGFDRALSKFCIQAATQLSAIQSVWQQGEFIRLALDVNRVDLAIRVALRFVRALPASGAEAALFARPGRSLFLNTDTNAAHEPLGAMALRGTDVLLFMAFYVPLHPDLATSLALVKRIVQKAPVGAIDPDWFTTILQAEDFQFYIEKFTPYFSNWFHVMRHAHTIAAMRWLLMGPERLLPVHIASANAVHTVRAIEYAPPEIRDLLLDAILHTQPRGVIVIDVRGNVAGHWKAGRVRDAALAVIDQHLAMHAPDTTATAAAQHRIMHDLTDQMTRVATSNVPFDVASMVMDYVRRDETVDPTRSARTPYKQGEEAALRGHLADAQVAVAREHVAASSVRPLAAAAAARPLPSEEEGEEEEKGEDGDEDEQQKRARTRGRFRAYTPTYW